MQPVSAGLQFLEYLWVAIAASIPARMPVFLLASWRPFMVDLLLPSAIWYKGFGAVHLQGGTKEECPLPKILQEG